MEVIFLGSEQRSIQGKDYTKITVYEKKTEQVFVFYRLTDEKAFNFVKNTKLGQDITDQIRFVIKKGQKITFDLK